MSDQRRSADEVSRRRFLAASAGSAVAIPLASAAAQAKQEPPVQQATGVRVGEVTDRSAIVWTRLTARPERNNDGVVFQRRKAKGEPAPTVPPVEQIEGSCPGAAGQVRVRYSSDASFDRGSETPWAEVSERTDFTHQFALADLKSDTTYYYAVETTGPGGTPRHGARQGKFTTGPAAGTPSDFRFCVMTCQGYPDRDHHDGHNIYPAMLALEPRFVSLTGDVVYYDNDEPRAVTPALARLHWERMFSLPRQIELLKNVATYWLKDDHDTLRDDAYPGNKLGLLSFDEGQRIFREQTPLGDRGYRTYRWGRDLQIWLTDGRDNRSSNNLPDGPEKTIWGNEQKAWFKRTVQESDATWKLLISPTPLVGPDRPKKNDNHANQGFAHEGNEIREWIQANVPENFFVACGDRHWQYHSVHPTTGVQEFSVGAASDQHAGGTPGEDKKYHRFHRVKGGFLTVELKPTSKGSRITFQHRDVHGAVVYEFSAERAVKV
jgi:alkaline phosphatase D